MGKPKPRPHPGFVGSKGVLALIDEEHPVPAGGWTAAKIAAASGISQQTALHHLERLRKWHQVTSSVRARAVQFRRASDNPERPPRQIQVCTLSWKITPKGEKRLALRGGHERHCPVCKRG